MAPPNTDSVLKPADGTALAFRTLTNVNCFIVPHTKDAGGLVLAGGGSLLQTGLCRW